MTLSPTRMIAFASADLAPLWRGRVETLLQELVQRHRAHLAAVHRRQHLHIPAGVEGEARGMRSAHQSSSVSRAADGSSRSTK
jgi:hypothetical protein